MNPTLQWQPLSPVKEVSSSGFAQGAKESEGLGQSDMGDSSRPVQNAVRQKFRNEAAEFDTPKSSHGNSRLKPEQVFVKWRKPLAFACVATLLQFGLFSALFGEENTAAKSQRVAILVSTKKLERGDAVTSENFKSVEVKSSEVLAAVVKAEDLEKFKGRKLAVSISANNALPKAALFSDLQQRSAPEHIPPGKRLYKLQAALGDLANVIKSGDRVDVIALMDLPQVGKITETLLEAQDVIGVGDILLDDKSSARQGDELSFFVTPEQFKLLTYAQNFAKFSIALRNPNDVARSDGGTAMTLNKFLANPRIQNAVNSDLFRIRKGSFHADQ